MLFSINQFLVFRLSMFYVAYFALVGIILPFFPVWLEFQGLSLENIGIVIGFSTFVRVFFDPFIAHLADRRGVRQPIIVLLSLLALLFFSFYFISNSFWTIFLVTILFSSCWGATQPLAENLTMLSARIANFQYGRIRLWGSITFILIAIIMGKILADNSPNIILLVACGTVCFLFIVSIFLPKITTSKSLGIKFPILLLIRNKTFILIVLAAALIQSSHAVYYGFGTIHWQNAGIHEVTIGLLWGEGVAAEVILFIFAGILLRYISPVQLVMLGGFLGIVRWMGMGLGDNLIVLFTLQILHSFTFGATHIGIIHFIANNISEEVSATAMSVYASVMGLTMGLMVMVSGHLYASLAGHAYFVVAIISAFGCVLCIYSLARRK